MRRFLGTLFLIGGLAFSIGAQSEVLTNAVVVEMSKVGLDKQVILQKIRDSKNGFDVSAAALIELKKAGVADEIISLMLEKAASSPAAQNMKPDESLPSFSESQPVNLEIRQFTPVVVNARDALLNARSVALVKSSLNPSRQGLEKALLKRKEWKKYELTLIRYKEEADIYVEIGRVPLSWITHRYVFRIYDRRSGTIITAGETTSWGSLAENLAREITQKMDAVSGK